MLLQHQSSRPTASPTHGRIPFFHVRPPCDTDLSNIKKDVPALRSRSKNKGRASPVPHKPTTRYPGHAHSHVRLHLDNNSILHHQRYLGQPFSSHPSEPQLGRPLATSIRHLVPIVYLLQYPPRNANLDLLHRHSPSFFCRSFFSSSAPLFSSDSHQHACRKRSSENRWGEPFDYHLSTLGKPRAELT